MHGLLVILAMEVHGSIEAEKNEEQSRFHAVESRPEDPEESSIS